MISERKQDEMLKIVMGEWYEFEMFGHKML